jgi:UDP-2,3-diacylglucosamine hydrolase
VGRALFSGDFPVGHLELNPMQAPPHWKTLDFISDLHLQASEESTFAAWQAYMQQTKADAVFILGDLFEVWVGDDAAADGFERQCALVLQATTRRIPVFFMHGNRDFLVGNAFMQQCQCSLLDDPMVLDFAGQNLLLSHGDALCLADVDYQQFRTKVRSEIWQRDFLAQPLAQRKTIARGLREQSELRKKSAVEYADLDSTAASEWLLKTNSHCLIHGHTHQPADHVLPGGLQRVVLSDWDLAAKPARGEVLRLEKTAGAITDGAKTVSMTRISPLLA